MILAKLYTPIGNFFRSIFGPFVSEEQVYSYITRKSKKRQFPNLPAIPTKTRCPFPC